MRNIDRSFVITEPMKLPWMYITPTESQGLEYHIDNELSIKIEGISNGSLDFQVGNILLGFHGEEVNELQAKEIFKHEILPNKTKERIDKSLRDGDVSCFFTVKEMEYLEKLFEENKLTSKHVEVLFNGKQIDDIPSLPPKTFKKLLDIFEDLNVVGVFDFAQSREEWEGEYEKAFQEKVAKEENEHRSGLWEKVTQEGVGKKIASAFSIVVTGGILMACKQNLNNRSGAKWKLLTGVVSGTSVLLEIYGKKKLNAIISEFVLGGKQKRKGSVV